MTIHKELLAYIDGSCSKTASAVGVIIVNPNAKGKGRKRLIAKQLSILATPPMAEVQAAIVAMRYANCRTLTIYSDSRYLVECATGKAVPKHNLDMWSSLYQAVEEYDRVTFVWVERNSHPTHKHAHKLSRIALFGGSVDRYTT